ncbi:MAG: hypothetical protein D6812_13965, partial [Deltaproteobacteria bacterium]
MESDRSPRLWRSANISDLRKGWSISEQGTGRRLIGVVEGIHLHHRRLFERHDGDGYFRQPQYVWRPPFRFCRKEGVGKRGTMMNKLERIEQELIRERFIPVDLREELLSVRRELAEVDQNQEIEPETRKAKVAEL